MSTGRTLKHTSRDGLGAQRLMLVDPQYSPYYHIAWDCQPKDHLGQEGLAHAGDPRLAQGQPWCHEGLRTPGHESWAVAMHATRLRAPIGHGANACNTWQGVAVLIMALLQLALAGSEHDTVQLSATGWVCAWQGCHK